MLMQSATIAAPKSRHSLKRSIEILQYPDICPKAKTVATPARILEEKHVVHVRGTPSSGKATLPQLLHQHYEDLGDPVILIDGWHNIPDQTIRYIWATNT